MTPCLELANMAYCDVCVQLWKFELNPDELLRERVLQMAEVGIQCLGGEEEGIRLIWTRMFLLRMANCILGIGKKATIIPKCTVTKFGIVKAEEILAVFGPQTNSMDKRRRMFYFMARGRLYDIKVNTHLAAKFVKMASELAEEGKFKEKTFICEYLQEIKTRENVENSRERDWEALDHSGIERDSFSYISDVQDIDLVRNTEVNETIQKEIFIRGSSENLSAKNRTQWRPSEHLSDTEENDTIDLANFRQNPYIGLKNGSNKRCEYPL